MEKEEILQRYYIGTLTNYKMKLFKSNNLSLILRIDYIYRILIFLSLMLLEDGQIETNQ